MASYFYVFLVSIEVPSGIVPERGHDDDDDDDLDIRVAFCVFFSLHYLYVLEGLRLRRLGVGGGFRTSRSWI